MAVVSVWEIYEREGTLDLTWARTYRRTFGVITDNPHDGMVVARSAPGINVGDPYTTGSEYDSFSFARAITATGDSDDGKQWKVTIEYGPWDVLQVENPLDVPIEVSWSFAQWEEIVDQDVNGNAVVNSAGDPFDPPVTRENSLPVLTIVRNEATFSAALAYAYKDKVNLYPFFGADPKTVKVADIAAHRQYHPTFGYFWPVQYQFAFDPRTWTKVILNQGLRKKVGSTRVNIVDAGNATVTSPVLLDATGTPIAPGGTPVFLSFEVYPAIDFSVFNLE